MNLRSCIGAVVLGLTLVGAPGDAHAEQTGPSYGVQTAAADVLSGGTALAGLFVGADDGTALWFGGLAVYAITSPIIHLVHGNPGRAAGSFAMRILGVPLTAVIGGFIGLGAANHCHGPSCSGYEGLDGLGVGVGIGAGVGMLTVSTIDAVFLAHEDAPAPPASGVTFSPSLGFDKTGARAGLGGTF